MNIAFQMYKSMYGSWYILDNYIAPLKYGYPIIFFFVPLGAASASIQHLSYLCLFFALHHRAHVFVSVFDSFCLS